VHLTPSKRAYGVHEKLHSMVIYIGKMPLDLVFRVSHSLRTKRPRPQSFKRDTHARTGARRAHALEDAEVKEREREREGGEGGRDGEGGREIVCVYLGSTRKERE
jgi:hypothetical protein